MDFSRIAFASRAFFRKIMDEPKPVVAPARLTTGYLAVIPFGMEMEHRFTGDGDRFSSGAPPQTCE
jgi:hypothetical protein